MKKSKRVFCLGIVFATAVLAAAMLSSCNFISRHTEGGSEGSLPEQTQNGKRELFSEKDPIRMVRIKEALYYETGEENEITGRCGTLSGTFKNTVNKYEIPKNDGDKNFISAEGWQTASENEVEIPVGDDWEIFRRIDTNTDLSEFVYCYTVEGRLPNAADDSDFLVLAKDMNITFQEAAEWLLGSQQTQKQDFYVMPIDD